MKYEITFFFDKILFGKSVLLLLINVVVKIII